jgi:hypothetical protein
MALVVEDGTGIADAESYLSVADADSYHAAAGNAAWPASGSEPEKEQALRRATRYITGKYRGRWPGERVKGRAQGLDWPRIEAYDSEGLWIDDDIVPPEVENATAEAALREFQQPGSLTPDEVSTAQIKRTRDKLGPLETEVEYMAGAGESVRPIVTQIDEILAGIFSAAESGGRFAFRQRA